MEEKDLVVKEVVPSLEGADAKDRVFVEDTLPEKPKNNFKNNGYKIKECKVIAYNNRSNTLDILFDNYGIRIKGVDDFNGDTVDIKYKGEIGKSTFSYKM